MSHSIVGMHQEKPARGHLDGGSALSELDAWRDMVVTRALWVFWMATSVILAVVLARNGLGRWLVLAPIGTAWLVLLFGVARTTLSCRGRSLCFIVGVTIGAVGSTLTSGFHLPNPFVALVGAMVVASLFSDQRAAWRLFGVISVLMVAMGVLFVLEVPVQRSWGLQDEADPLNWLRVVSVFVAFSAAILALASLFRARLEKALWDSQRLMDVLADENTQHLALLREQHALQQKVRQSQQLEALGTLSGGVAHDFNNLFLIIGSHAEMLARCSNPDERSQRSISAIRDATSRAAHLTSQLLTFSRQQVVEQTKVQLALAIDESLSMIEPLMPENITMQSGALDADLWVLCVRGDVDQVLRNLCVNARDAIPRGGTIKVTLQREERALPDGRGTQPFACLTVSDTGVGMSDETRDRVFEPFFTTKPVDQGTGLGLSVVHGLVARAEGFVEVDTGERQGTTFRAYWPLCTPDEMPVFESGPVPRAGRGGECILLVDDDSSVRSCIGELLEQRGYEVLSCADGVDAEATFRQRSSDIALVITDVIMPRMGGQALHQELVQLAPDLPFLFCSGYTGLGPSAKNLTPSSYDFLGKPFSSEALYEKVDALLARHRKQRALQDSLHIGVPLKLRVPFSG